MPLLLLLWYVPLGAQTNECRGGFIPNDNGTSVGLQSRSSARKDYFDHLVWSLSVRQGNGKFLEENELFGLWPLK